MNEELLKIIRDKCEDFVNIVMSNHVHKRLDERDIRFTDIINVMRKGEIIEDYPNDFPFPSCLMLGETCKGKPLHIVVAWGNDKLRVITAYFPTLDKFESDLKTRKKKGGNA